MQEPQTWESELIAMQTKIIPVGIRRGSGAGVGEILGPHFQSVMGMLGRQSTAHLHPRTNGRLSGSALAPSTTWMVPLSSAEYSKACAEAVSFQYRQPKSHLRFTWTFSSTSSEPERRLQPVVGNGRSKGTREGIFLRCGGLNEPVQPLAGSCH
jgi:hypothetical protein